MAGLGLQGAAGTSALTQAIRQVLAERQARDTAIAAAEYKRQQDAIKNALDSRTVGVSEGRLGLDTTRLNEIDKPKSVADIAHTTAETSGLTQEQDYKAKDRAETDRLIAGLSPDALSPNRPSPRTVFGLKRFGVDMTTPGAERALVPAGALGGEAAATNAAEWDGSGERIARDKANIGANAAIRVNAATQSAAQTKLPAALQDDLITMATVSDLADQAVTLGDAISWRGVGGMKAGTIQQFAAKNFGKGDPREQSLRNIVGNIKGTIAKLRGGTSFTPNEQALLDTYTPSIDDDKSVIKQKFADLKNFIATKRRNTIAIAGGGAMADGMGGQSSGVVRWTTDAQGNPIPVR